jgi:hypothetical protein
MREDIMQAEIKGREENNLSFTTRKLISDIKVKISEKTERIKAGEKKSEDVSGLKKELEALTTEIKLLMGGKDESNNDGSTNLEILAKKRHLEKLIKQLKSIDESLQEVEKNKNTEESIDVGFIKDILQEVKNYGDDGIKHHEELSEIEQLKSLKEKLIETKNKLEQEISSI